MTIESVDLTGNVGRAKDIMKSHGITVLGVPPYGCPVVDSLKRFTIMMRSLRYTRASRRFHKASLMRVCGERARAGDWSTE